MIRAGWAYLSDRELGCFKAASLRPRCPDWRPWPVRGPAGVAWEGTARRSPGRPGRETRESFLPGGLGGGRGRAITPVQAGADCHHFAGHGRQRPQPRAKTGGAQRDGWLLLVIADYAWESPGVASQAIRCRWRVADVASLTGGLPALPAAGGAAPASPGSVRGSVWTQLQDIHEALGLRYQWGGSYCNKALLCCLGIDTRNILFTGQKKQPVIVPMYAASLGMLEPTKEPVKPVSAAEMIASIAQAPPVAPEKSSCPSDSVQQEALPPVQFDWSSSGLTNPLDGR
ncbi:hypothetical protein PFLUV_G00001390 [Perca fluviatilis]|uniref:Aftiphilin clathrin-binding box domain-containing protein n=1 Tax=Perca fluviatilis TaxID=8168 RepID=A0A6A5FIP7_PERFL|nr:hypothetical protein PFLUV_G00001390 [Perca fluviatilis]